MATAQQKVLAIAPKFTALSSVVGSAVLLYLILRRDKRRTYHRLVLGMTLCDFSASVAWFCTTWPIPRGTPGVYGAVGNQQTCSAQAFFAQFSLSTVMYNASLALYYFLVVVRGWGDDRIARIEPLLHANAVAWGLGTALASLGLTLFNQVGWDCWISSAPLGCQESWNSPEGEGTCERGDNGSLYQWAFYYAPLWAVIVLVSGLMYSIYYVVRSQERRMTRYGARSVLSGKAGTTRAGSTQSEAPADPPAGSEGPSMHKRIAVQAALYVGAFFITWFFPTIFQLVIVTTGTFPYPLLFLTAFFVPIQGLLNLIVYTQSHYIKYKTNNPGQWFAAAWFRMLGQEIRKARNEGGGLCRRCLPR